MRVLKVHIGLLVAVFCFAFFALGQTKVVPSMKNEVTISVPKLGSGYLVIPDPKSVKAISVEVYRDAYVGSDDNVAEVQQFAIREDALSETLNSLFQNAEIESHQPAPSVEIALVCLLYENGSREHIQIFWSRGKNDLVYSFRGFRIRQTKMESRALPAGDGALEFIGKLFENKAMK